MEKRLLVFDIYGTLLDIYTIEKDPKVWKAIKNVIVFLLNQDYNNLKSVNGRRYKRYFL